MKNAEFVCLFYGCLYDAERSRILWNSDGEQVYVLLDADGRASSAFVSYETDDGDWTDWKILPSSFCKLVSEGLDRAKDLGIAYEDVGRAVLDSDLENVVLV